MSIDNSANSDPQVAAQPEVAATKEVPRFIIASQRYEQFLISKAEEGGDPNERIHYFADVMAACGGLIGVSQTYEFISTHPDLAGSPGVDIAGQDLASALAQPGIPDEVRAIYMDLYGEGLSQYSSSAEI